MVSKRLLNLDIRIVFSYKFSNWSVQEQRGLIHVDPCKNDGKMENVSCRENHRTTCRPENTRFF